MRDGDVVTVEAIARAALQLRRCDGDDDQADTGPGGFSRCGGDGHQGDTGPGGFARCGGDQRATSPGRLHRCG